VAQPIGGLGNRVHINGIEFSLFIALGHGVVCFTSVSTEVHGEAP
jgi:hypothetical protein